ncbi:DUF3857 domain-containing protein [Sediminicola sp. 1XM1-17]|uniref:DUF3857 domain-containing protein n=1 Tax=Sediminicola sp. 1XM1-17 TaxID=3127702 RepID=UPI0030768E97
MTTKTFTTWAALLFVGCLFSQFDRTFGNLSKDEEAFTVFAKDSTANAVVLYEKGETYFKGIDRRIQLVKTYHAKIKILDENAFSEGNIAIPYYNSGGISEVVKDIRAITHNGRSKIGLAQNTIYTNNINERWSEIRFAFPKVQVGSILEYQYTIISPYLFNLTGWVFQSHIPKVYSEFNAMIPGNYIYNRTFVGNLKLDVNAATVEKNCFHLDGVAKSADCEVLKYAMKDIPAFKKEEEFMLSESNYISKINFELSEHYNVEGSHFKHTKTWDDVDKEFKSDKDIGRQLTKQGFLEKRVPDVLLSEGDDLTRATNIFNYIKSHFTWNGRYGIYHNVRVKEAFEERKGNVGEINISLINLLRSADIKTDLMLLSTRENGLPTKSHPVISDFNYIVAKVEIDGQDYLLDATDKLNPFGMLPFRCLNYYGRVMDFEDQSYWYTIEENENNNNVVRVQLDLDATNNKASGMFDNINMGYEALKKRKVLTEIGEEAYLNQLSRPNFFITAYDHQKERSDDKKVAERFSFEMEDLMDSDLITINPFIIRFFSKNPFLLEERNYPIDFGYKRSYSYYININVPKEYSVLEIPEKKLIALTSNNGSLKFDCTKSPNGISLYFHLTLDKVSYDPNVYPDLKELFKIATNIQNHSLIVLKKV